MEQKFKPESDRQQDVKEKRTLDDQVRPQNTHSGDTDTRLRRAVGSTQAGEDDGRRAAHGAKEGLSRDNKLVRARLSQCERQRVQVYRVARHLGQDIDRLDWLGELVRAETNRVGGAGRETVSIGSKHFVANTMKARDAAAAIRGVRHSNGRLFEIRTHGQLKLRGW